MISFSTEADETDLLDLDAVKAELGITGGEFDENLERFIATVSKRFAKICSRDADNGFGAAVASEVFRLSEDAGRLWLAHWPVTSITSIVEDGVTLAADEYELEDKRKLYRLDGDDNRICWPAVKIVVTYPGGYDLPDGCPEDLQRAAMQMVKLMHFGAARDPLLRSEDIPGVLSQSFALPATAGGMNAAIPDDVAGVLANYRNSYFG